MMKLKFLSPDLSMHTILGLLALNISSYVHLLAVMDRNEPGYETAIKKIGQLDKIIRKQEEKPVMGKGD